MAAGLVVAGGGGDDAEVSNPLLPCLSSGLARKVGASGASVALGAVIPAVQSHLFPRTDPGRGLLRLSIFFPSPIW